MMRITQWMLVALAGALMAACSADVADSGGYLRAVDEDAMTSQTLYMVPEASVYPMTAAALEAEGLAETDAIPVRVEILDDVAVAWFAPAGEAVISVDSIVALWRVVDRQPIAGEVTPGERPEVIEALPYVEAEVTLTLDADETHEVQTVDPGGAAATIVDFYDRLGTPEEWWMLNVLRNHHPGC